MAYTGVQMGRESTVTLGISTKNYFGYQETLQWMHAIRTVVDQHVRSDARIDIFVAPAFPTLESAIRIFEGSPVRVAAQDVSAAAGVATGEVSADMLRELGVSIIEVGHAERRRYFGDSPDRIRKKTEAVLKAGMQPLVCIGEPDRGPTCEAVRFCAKQLDDSVDVAEASHQLIVAYEPVWAIGKTHPATPLHVDEVVTGLRERYGSLRIIYGGAAGAGTLTNLTTIDGLFLGRFAHEPDTFAGVIQEASARLAATSVC